MSVISSSPVLNFNPRSREGSDVPLFADSVMLPYFNPRSREGSDENPFYFARNFCYFNPRSREGSDVRKTVFSKSSTLFQSTLPRRERPKRFSVALAKLDFNPRSREGSDARSTLQCNLFILISIHAPAKGATYNLITVCETE